MPSQRIQSVKSTRGVSFSGGGGGLSSGDLIDHAAEEGLNQFGNSSPRFLDLKVDNVVIRKYLRLN